MVPDPTFGVRLPVDLAARVRAYAALARRPVQDVVREALERAVLKTRTRISYRWKPHGAFADATPLRVKKAHAPAWMIKQAIRSEKGCR